MFKTAAQIADAENTNPPGSSLFVSAAKCFTDDIYRRDADTIVSTSQVTGHREPASKQAPMARSRPSLIDKTSIRPAVQCSPVKRTTASMDSIPPSIVRLSETVKDRISTNIWHHRCIDLSIYKKNLHILPLRQLRVQSHDKLSICKGHDMMITKNAIAVPQLSNTMNNNSRMSIVPQMVQLWSLLVNNKIYDCLGYYIDNKEGKKYQSIIRTLMKLLDCTNAYFDIIDFTQKLLSYQNAIHSLSSNTSRTLFPPPLVSPPALLRALASGNEQNSISLDQLIPNFVHLLTAYRSQCLMYDPYSDALIGKQKAILRHKELGAPKFCTYILSRTAPQTFEQLSVIYGSIVFPAFTEDLNGRDSSAILYNSFHEYELHRLSFFAGTLAENFSLCKAVAFALVDNTLLAHQCDEVIVGRTMYALDTELLSHISSGTLEDNKLAGMIILPYSHELEELIFCGTRTHDTANGSGEIDFYYNLTISQHADLITLLYTEICRYTDGILTVNRLYLILIALGLDPKLAGYEWFLLQYQLSIVRLAKTQVLLINIAKPGPQESIRSILNPYTILLHCMLKYKLEFDSDFVPLLKRIHRQDITANSCTGIYLIVDIRISQSSNLQEVTLNPPALDSLDHGTCSANNLVVDATPPIRPQQKGTTTHTNNTSIESLDMLITDGFYLVKASVDPLLFNFLTKNKIRIHKHEKILVSLPQTINFGSAQEPPIRADWNTEEALVLTYYNTRIAPQAHFLGRFHRPFISMSISDAIDYALGTKLYNHKAGDTNLVPHMSALVVKIFDCVMVVKKAQEQANDDSENKAESGTKTYYYRRILVVDPGCININDITHLSEDLESSSSKLPQLPCLFLHQFGSKANIIESFEPGLQIELISTSIKRYNPHSRGLEGTQTGSYLQLSPSAIICSQAANKSIPKELRNILNKYYQNCLLSVRNTLGGLELLCDHTVFFYCLGTSGSGSIPPMYCFQLSNDSSRIFDLIEVIQNAHMSTIFIHSAKDQISENEAIEFKNPPRKLSKLTIKTVIIQNKGHGKYRLMCLDETVLKTTGDMFFYENEEQTDMYVQILEESIHKYL